MSARKFQDFDADEFKRTTSEEYNNVTQRLREERKRLNFNGVDMAKMLSIAINTYYEEEQGKYSIKNDNLKIMYDNGFDIEYIFTGNRMPANISFETFARFNDNEIENLLRNLCVFIKDFKDSYKSLKRICDEKDDMFYYIINRNGKQNVYEIYRIFHSYNQEEMATRSGYSLNAYKKIKKTLNVLRPDSKQIYIIYKGLNIPPLMCVDNRASNISELTKLAKDLEAEAIPELRKMNPTLYNVLYPDIKTYC